MSIRRDPIYVSSEVWRWLWILAKATPETDRETLNSGRRTASPDEIADNILRRAILEQHPELPAHQNQIERLEKELIERLQKHA